jgi:hypothetical protein
MHEGEYLTNRVARRMAPVRWRESRVGVSAPIGTVGCRILNSDFGELSFYEVE